jgi:hypothetical protein
MKKLFNFFENLYYRLKNIIFSGNSQLFPREVIKHLGSDLYSETPFFKKGHPWGNMHPKYPYQYWDKSEDIFYPPFKISEFEAENGTQRKVDVFFGNKFYEGERYIEMAFTIPKGDNLWYGYWGHGESAPPEYDIMEIFTDDKGNIKFCSNFHHGKDYEKNKKSAGSKNHKIKEIIHPLIFNDKKFITIGILFKKEFMLYFINGVVVRRINGYSVDNKHLEPMNIIIGSGCMPEKNIKDAASESEVRYVKVYKKR